MPDGATKPRPGDFVDVEVTHGAPYHLLADSALSDGGLYKVRPTRAGDVWQAKQESVDADPVGVSLGIPVLRTR